MSLAAEVVGLLLCRLYVVGVLGDLLNFWLGLHGAGSVPTDGREVSTVWWGVGDAYMLWY